MATQTTKVKKQPPRRSSTQAKVAVTMRDVAKACGLSVYPVSRALNGKEGVNPETVTMVRKVAEELGYNYGQNDLARRLSLRKSGETPVNHVIGLLMPNHVEDVNFFFTLFRGISKEISSAGYGLLMLPTYDQVEHRDMPVQFPPSVMRGEVDGLLVQSGLTVDILSHLREDTGFGNRPIVTLSTEIDDCPCIQRDLRLGAKLAVEHLLTLGHRRILYFHKDGYKYPDNNYLTGYYDACIQAGLEPADCLIPIRINHDYLLEKPLRDTVAQHPEATALVAHNDLAAISAGYILQDMGLGIPENISIVGSDDTDPFPDNSGNNLLTTVHYDIASMGQKAARLLLDTIEGRTITSQTTLMPPKLVIRGSTRPLTT